MPQLLTYLWSFPTTCIGLPFVAASLIGCGSMRVVDGVLEIHGPWIQWFLRRCIPIPGGAAAMTLGHIVIGRDQQCLDSTRSHERVHVRQCERWGPMFIPAYLFFSLRLLIRGGDAYRDNPFEREAYDRA